METDQQFATTPIPPPPNHRFGRGLLGGKVENPGIVPGRYPGRAKNAPDSVHGKAARRADPDFPHGPGTNQDREPPGLLRAE